MKFSVAAARDLAERVMAALGHNACDSASIADHLIDCELRGLDIVARRSENILS